MNYVDGQEVRLGDIVKLGEDNNGVVVCSLDTDEYSLDQPKEAWGYLKRGVIISFPKFGLIHYLAPEEDLVLLSRSQQK